MAEAYTKYKNLPVTGIELSKIKKFLGSNQPYKVILQVGLLPKGATVTDMVQQCSAAIEELLSKYQKYKELGYVKDETQLMALGQLTNNSKIIKNYLIARSWRFMPEVEKTNAPTKSRFVSTLNDWFNYHKNRIGWDSVTTRPTLIPDPDNPKNPSKSISYHLSDRYNKPINQCLYPDLRKHPVLGKISLSVAQSERILLGIVDRFKNENDLVYFAEDRKDESDANKVITMLSHFNTDKSKTAAGVKNEYRKTIYEIIKAKERWKNRRQKEMLQVKSENDALMEIQKLDQEKAEFLAKEKSVLDMEKGLIFDTNKENDYLKYINEVRKSR